MGNNHPETENEVKYHFVLGQLFAKRRLAGS
jgi:hypothetical protein